VRRLFLRIYLALGLVLFVAAGVIALLAPRGDRASLEDQIEALAGVAPGDVQARFEVGASATDVAAALAEELGHPVTVLPEEAVVGSVGGHARRSLAEGQAVVHLHDAGPAIYVPISSRTTVAVLRPAPPAPSWTATSGLVVAALVLLAAGFAVLAVVRPLERQLQQIGDAAEAIGAGELGARAEVQREDAAGRLAGSFNAMAEQVESIVEGRRELLHGVSHELRTPLARLRFAVELLTGDFSADQLRERTSAVMGDVQDLEGLVSELLRYSELEGGAPLHLEPTDLSDLVGHLVSEARRVGREAEFEWRRPASIWVALDRRLAKRSISNLVNNAARYATSQVRVSLERDGGWVRVIVEDDGPGVADEDRERIFDPFSRLDEARSRDTGGIGLGLPIARRAARSHGGDIQVDSSELGGARFAWSVPAG